MYKTDLQKGTSLATELNSFGVPCEYVESKESARIITHFIRLDNRMDLLKMPKVIKVLEMATGAKVNISDCAMAGCVGFEVEKEKPSTLILENYLKDLKPYSVLIGEGMDGEVQKVDFEKVPHLLIAGSTGAGKSVILHNIAKSILTTNEDGNFYHLLMIDPKKISFTEFEGAKNTEIATSFYSSIEFLKFAVSEMYERYEQMRKEKLKNWVGYKIVVIIDELADLIMTDKKAVEPLIVKLAQMGRACGVHLVIATQKPVVAVCTGLIKANIPDRIALRCASVRDSMVILEEKGAEKLKGKGDCLIKINGEVKRVQSFISKDLI